MFVSVVGAGAGVRTDAPSDERKTGCSVLARVQELAFDRDGFGDLNQNFSTRARERISVEQIDAMLHLAAAPWRQR